MNTLTVYPFEFKKYRTKADRLTCPGCGRAHALVPYIDVATGEDLPERFGRCNRVDSCGYHEKPSTKDLNRSEQEWDQILKDLAARPVKPEIIVDLPADMLIDSLVWSEENTLYKYLIKLLPAERVKELFVEYLIGNHSVWLGAVVLWFVDKDGAIRAGQVKQFGETGHTVKMPDKDGRIKPRTIWIHSLITEPLEWLQAYLDQKLKCDCLFGEHLLQKYPDRPVALFESPKTAILAAAHFPDMLCLATGALDYFSYDRVKVLKGKKVILYPDLSKDGKAFASWSEKAERFKSVTDFKVSRILEDNATDEEKALGLDMADFLERTPLIVPSQNATPSTAAKIGEPDNQSVKEELTPSVANQDKGVTKRDTPTSSPKSEKCEDIKKEEVRLPNPMEAGKETNRSETSSENFDVEEHRKWLKTVPELPSGQSIKLNSLSSAYPFDHVFLIKSFVTGRLNSIEAWCNSQRGPGDKALHIRQVQELRTIINHNQQQ